MQAAGTQWITYPSRKTEVRIWHLSDLHWMSESCAEGKLKSDIQEIADDPNAFWTGGGDYAEFIGYRDKRFDPDAVAKRITVQQLGRLAQVGYHEVRDLFLPIRHKCLGLLQGNHERQYELHTEQQHWTTWLCKELDVLNLGYCALFDVVLRRAPSAKVPKLLKDAPKHDGASCNSWKVRFFAHHGAGFAQTPGGKMNRLVQFMNSFEADVYMAGHVHDQIGRRQPIIAANALCTELQTRDRVGIVSGSYLKTYALGTTSYGEQKGYPPVNLGAASVTLVPGNGSKPNRIKAEV